MISGFHVDISGKEMKALLMERQKYHEDKAALYSKKAAEISKALNGVEDDLQVGKVSNSGSKTLEEQATHHRDSAVFYKFAAEHTPENETFRLDKADLQLLGIMSGRYY